MTDDSNSEEWLDRQKQKLHAMKEGSRYSEDWKDRQNRQLVEELKSRQHSWKQEKTEKTTETIDGGGSPQQQQRISRDDNAPSLSNVALHPIQIGTIGGEPAGQPRSVSAKYYYETKHKEIDEPAPGLRNGGTVYRTEYYPGGQEEVAYSKREAFFKERNTTTDSTGHPRRTGERYEALNSLPVGSGHLTTRHYSSTGGARDVPILYKDAGHAYEDTRSNYSHSQGYNTLTSEEEYDGGRGSTLKSSDGRTRLTLDRYRPDQDNTVRVRSQSFGTASGPASDVFREAIRHVGPDGEIVYTSRKYDTKKTTTEASAASEERDRHQLDLCDRDRRCYQREAVQPVYQPYDNTTSYVDDDGAVVVTETYKRVREVKTEGGASGGSVSAEPIRSLRDNGYRDRVLADRGPRMIANSCGRDDGGDEEYTYRRRYYESQTVPQSQGSQQTLGRSRSVNDFGRDDDYYNGSRDGGGGKTYYYHKTSTYDDAEPPPSLSRPVTNGGSGGEYRTNREEGRLYQGRSYEDDHHNTSAIDRGNYGHIRQAPLQSSTKYQESHRYAADSSSSNVKKQDHINRREQYRDNAKESSRNFNNNTNSSRAHRSGYDHYNTGGSTSSSYYDTSDTYPHHKSQHHAPSRREMEELNVFLKDFGGVK